MTDAADLEAGDVVLDREDDPPDRDEAVVVNTPPVAADEWDVGNETVAEYGGNEEYPDDDPVVCVVYRPAFAVTEREPEDVDEPIPLREFDVKHYTFPASRLRVVERRESPEEGAQDDDSDDEASGEGDTPEDTGDPTTDGQRDALDTPADAPPDLAAIAAAVRERNVDDVTVDQDAGVVRVEKLGLAYTIKRDGTVLDSGAFADALEDVAEAALGDEADDEEVVA